MRRSFFVLAASICAACLPDDTRPPPSALTIVVVSDAATPIQTSDGWQIVLDRLLVSVGEAQPEESDDCFVYNETDYLRVLDGMRPEPQLLSKPYALGECDLSFRLLRPNADSALGSGITNDDLILLGTPASDDYVPDSGLSLFVAGNATDGARTKRFEWSFRNGVQYDPCTAIGGGPLLSLPQNGSQTIAIELVPASLFQSTSDATSPLEFEDIAAADDDANADGTVDFAELANVTLSTPEPPFESIADRIYLGRLPLVLRMPNASCTRGPIQEDDGP
jgi:hypothetical protein